MQRALMDSAPRDIGSIISRHSLRKEYRTFSRLLTISGLSTASVSAVYGIYRWYYAYRHFGPAAVARWSGPAIGLSLAAAVLGLLGLAYLLHLRGLFARVHSGGILIGRRGKVETILWDQIGSISMESIRYGLPWFSWGSSSKITLHLKPDGKRSLSHSLSNLDQLAITAKKYVYPGLLEEYRNSLQHGDAVQFGSIEITRRELVYKKRRYLWSEIGKVSSERGFLSVYTGSSKLKRRMRISTQRIPNVDLCFQLMQHFINEGNTKQQGT
jgi:hypothetical protein